MPRLGMLRADHRGSHEGLILIAGNGCTHASRQIVGEGPQLHCQAPSPPCGTHTVAASIEPTPVLQSQLPAGEGLEAMQPQPLLHHPPGKCTRTPMQLFAISWLQLVQALGSCCQPQSPGCLQPPGCLLQAARAQWLTAPAQASCGVPSKMPLHTMLWLTYQVSANPWIKVMLAILLVTIESH